MTQSNSERFNIGDVVEHKSPGGPKMTIGRPVTKEAQELRGEATSIARMGVEQMVQLHAQFHSLAAQERLSVTELFELPADQFKAKVVDGNAGLAREEVYCEWFERGTLKRGFFPSEVLKRAREEEK